MSSGLRDVVFPRPVVRARSWCEAGKRRRSGPCRGGDLPVGVTSTTANGSTRLIEAAPDLVLCPPRSPAHCTPTHRIIVSPRFPPRVVTKGRSPSGHHRLGSIDAYRASEVPAVLSSSTPDVVRLHLGVYLPPGPPVATGSFRLTSGARASQDPNLERYNGALY